MTNDDREKKLEKLIKLIEKNTSYKQVFMFGVIRGFGAALGATVVLTVVVAVLNKLIEYNLPLITEWLVFIVNSVKMGVQ